MLGIEREEDCQVTKCVQVKVRWKECKQNRNMLMAS